MPSARQGNWAKFRASAVILAGLLILGTLAFLLTGGTILEPKTQIYLFLPDATGVAPGSPVRVDGIGVGKVILVELSDADAIHALHQISRAFELEFAARHQLAGAGRRTPVQRLGRFDAARGYRPVPEADAPDRGPAGRHRAGQKPARCGHHGR